MPHPRIGLRTLIVFVVPALALGMWIAGRPPVCQAHGILMRTESVPIAYGLLRFSNYKYKYNTSKLFEFPNCDDPVRRGCIVQPETTFPKHVCHRCNAARDAWIVANPETAEPHEILDASAY